MIDVLIAVRRKRWAWHFMGSRILEVERGANHFPCCCQMAVHGQFGGFGIPIGDGIEDRLVPP